MFISPYLQEIIKLALLEDIGCGDITTDACIPNGKIAQAEVVVKEPCVIAGLFVFEEVFKMIDKDVILLKLKNDGETAQNGDIIAKLKGNAKSIVTGERVSLNFLQRLSGIATMTRKFVNEIKGFDTRIVDTRKTTPGLRALEKYAVRVGGGFNHRLSLDGGILIKNNHIKITGSVKNALQSAKSPSPHPLKIQVEVSNFEEAKEAIEAGADLLLLDNMELKEIKKVIDFCKSKVEVEVSGNITLKNIKEVAETGVNYISVGSITHSAPWIDISLYVRDVF